MIPHAAAPLVDSLTVVFTHPTGQRFVTLLLGALLTTGRRTVSNILRTLGPLAAGHASSYHRVLSQARWGGLRLACALVRFLVFQYCQGGEVVVAGDDTVSEHRGKRVYGKARHRDPVRSSHAYTAHRYGHKWVVLSVLVKFPFATRPWALPVMVALYHSPKADQQRGHRHRTPVQIMELLLRLMLRWFPERRFVFVGDGNYGTHELARFAKAHRDRLRVVSRFYGNANLYDPPPPRQKQRGRPRVKGAKRPSPQQVVSRKRRTRLTVAWYGGGQREVEVVSDVGHWFKSGHGLVELRWVFVHDRTGTHRDEFFFCTDRRLSPRQIIELYTSRWNIEVTFQEGRESLGLDSTKGWCKQTVLRAAPCLFGLYTVVALLYAHLCEENPPEAHIEWAGKAGITFSDALTAVRRWLWQDWIFATCGCDKALSKIPQPLHDILLYALAPAP